MVLGQNRLDSFSRGHKILSTEYSMRYQDGSRIPFNVWIGEGLDYAAYTARKTMSRNGVTHRRWCPSIEPYCSWN